MPAMMPAFLQKSPLINTWSEKRRSHFNEFVTESGYPLRSKFPGAALTDIQFEIFLTEAEKDDFDAFYQNDCAEGAVSFYMEDMPSRAQAIFWWISAPEYSQETQGLYRVRLNLTRE